MATKEKKAGRGKFTARKKKTRQADMLRRASRHTEQRQAQEARKAKAPAVNYSQPAPFNHRRLVIQLGIVAAVVVAILLGISVFFNVENVVVHGSDKYDAWTIREASGINEGENLLTFGSMRAKVRILEELPYIQNVRIGVSLPDTVNIYVTEYPVVYSIQDADNAWWLIGSDGKVVDQTDVGAAAAHTKILGVTLHDPVVGADAVAAEGQPESVTNTEGETVPVPVVTSGEDRLEAAMTVMAALEKCDVLGQVASVDVTKPGDIIAWYSDRFEVLLGGTGSMNKKIAWMRDAVAQMEQYQTGTLDVTFTNYPNQAAFTPFE
ncbi:MAG: FtsQ-type POTRA domain-containing protein [Oscillospiraceae bacterium]|nr:FtsQ-type POTRA domain-containing protein [Oscillospiraceae bacterium]